MKDKKKKQEEQEPLPAFTVTEASELPSFSIEPQAPAPQPPPPDAIPMAQPVDEKPKGEEFQCPECSKIFIVALEKRPLHIRCPYCGLEGMVE